MASNLENRIGKLEKVRGARSGSYVVRLSHDEFQLSDPERQVIINQRSGGRAFVAVMPEKCADFADWMTRYGNR